MKTKAIYITTWILLICVFAIFPSCKGDRDKVSENETQIESGTITDKNTETDDVQIDLQPRLGSAVDANLASILTHEFYKDACSDSAKSVHYTKAELLRFFEIMQLIADSSTLCPEKSLGVRLYFAKYPNTEAYRFRGQETVILRLTCDGKDIPHQFVGNNETPKVAYNYGDVCPPLCNPKDTSQHFPMDAGKYNSRGNCHGCPQ